MLITKELAEALRYLSTEQQWSEADKAEVRAAIREDVAFHEHFWPVLAQAHRAGFRFSPQHDHASLEAFCTKHGLLHPFQTSEAKQ